MKWDELSDDVREVMENRGHDAKSVERMSPRKVFDEFCHWHGLIGWGDQLYDLVHELDGAPR